MDSLPKWILIIRSQCYLCYLDLKVLFCSLAILDPRVGQYKKKYNTNFVKCHVAVASEATPWTYLLHLSLSSVIRTDSSTGSPVLVLMLSIQAVRGLPRLRAPGIVLAWQWHQLGHMQTICISLQTEKHASTRPLNFYRPDALPAAQPTASKH